jgi:serine/threonine-protein kinase
MRVSGGQKEVFRARHEGEDVVLKLVRVSENDQIRTEREIAAVAKLNSDYVPPVLRHGCCVILDTERHFIVENYIEGQTYREVLHNRPVQDLQSVLSLTNDLLSACADFEVNQLVHRDIKPENMIIDTDGQTWIIDFGLARHLDLSSATPDGAYRGVGTLGYAAPEQFRNIKPEINTRADLFSVGVVLYESLYGRNPYIEVGNDPLTIIRFMENQDLSRLAIPNDEDGRFAEFIAALTQRYPSRRPQNAAEAIDWFTPIFSSLSQ